MDLSSEAVAVIGFIVLFALMLLRVPVGMAMGLVGVSGFGYISGGGPALKMVGQTSMRIVTDYTFGVIPMFLLMGSVASRTGMSRELFQAANRFVGHWRGVWGSPRSRLARGLPRSAGPRWRQRRRSRPLRIRRCAVATIAVIGAVRPGWLPAARVASWRERYQAVKEVWAPLLLFVFVIGGLYGGLFTPTEAGGMGAGGAVLISMVRRRLSRADLLASLLQATRTAAAVFTVLIGAILFGYFLTITRTPQKVTEFITGLGWGPIGALVLIMLMYLVLGCLMDAMAMVILTVPIIFPAITALGFDPIWFGIIVVMTVELGLIHPPVGMNVFVIKTVVQDVSFSTIFYGVIPFVLTDIVRLAILIAFPAIATWLPGRM